MKNLRLKIIIATGILAVLGVSTILIFQSSLLNIDKFTVEGNRHTPSEHVIAISGLRKGDKLFPLNFGAAENSIERLPWVKNASIGRAINGTITFSIEERTPRAVAFSRQGYVLLDGEGRVLEIIGANENCIQYSVQYSTELSEITCIANLIVPSAPGSYIRKSNLPFVDAATLIHSIKKCLQPETAVGCPENSTARLNSYVRQIVMNQTGERAISIQLKGGGWLLLGNPAENLEGKLERAFQILTGDSDSIRALCGNAFLDLSSNTNSIPLTPDVTC